MTWSVPIEAGDIPVKALADDDAAAAKAMEAMAAESIFIGC